MKRKNIIVLILISIGIIYQIYKYPEKQKRKEIIELYQKGEFEESKQKAIVFLEKHHDSKGMQTFLGNIYVELFDTISAEKAYLKGLETNPKDDKALVGLGVIARMQGKYEEAKRRYNEALKINPANPEAYSSLLILELKKGNYAN